MFDAFNLTNSHASETITRTTGTSYLQAERDPGATHGARRLPFHLLSSTPVGELKGGALSGTPFSYPPKLCPDGWRLHTFSGLICPVCDELKIPSRLTDRSALISCN